MWWSIAFSAFVVPAFWRFEKEGREWPLFARWTADLTVDWHSNYHVWLLSGVAVSALSWSSLRRPADVRLRRIARSMFYLYLSVLFALCVLMATASTL